LVLGVHKNTRKSVVHTEMSVFCRRGRAKFNRRYEKPCDMWMQVNVPWSPCKHSNRSRDFVWLKSTRNAVSTFAAWAS